MHAAFHALNASHLRLALPGGAMVNIPWQAVSEIQAQTTPATGGALAHGLTVVTPARTWTLQGLGPRRTQDLWSQMRAAQSKAQVAEVAPAAPAPRHRLVLSGPGCGKTTRLVAHAAQQIAQGMPPAQILMLAFTRSAQASLRARLHAQLGAAGQLVAVRTFHGLAADIVAQASGVRPRLSALADQPQAQVTLLEDALLHAMDADLRLRGQQLSFFAWHLHPAQEALDFASWDDLRAHLRTLDLRTLAGERVRSRGEWLIANWLFLHGIDYVYERPIPPALLPEGGRYRPDFFLPAHGVYIEHLGLDGKGQPPVFMDPDRYLAQLKWKRAWHAKQPTRLVETCAFESADGTLPKMLALRLAQAGVVAKPLAWEVVRDKLDRRHTVSRLATLAANFLRLLGARGETLATCRARLNQGRWRERSAAFLDLMEPLAAAYHAALAQEDAVDFDGLIAQATQAAASGAWTNPFAAVLVDEAQDLSPTRTGLLRAVLGEGARVSPPAHTPKQPAGEDTRAPTCICARTLFAVGDDRQAIFGFSGSEANALRQLNAALGLAPSACEVAQQRTTFRMGASLARMAEDFIGQDPRHQRAPMLALRQGAPQPVCVVRTSRPRDGAEEALAQISSLVSRDRESPTLVKKGMRCLSRVGDSRSSEASATQSTAPSVLLLTRYGATLRTCQVERLRQRFPQLRLEAKTIHAAKGLEADFVVILDLTAGHFPSSRKGDPLLHLVQPGDPFPHAEERRLFFVALTRAREGVWLVADRDKPSPFVEEVMGLGEKL